MNKLPEELKTPWLAALRSGKYKQGRGRLSYIGECGTTKYCCMGVFGEINKAMNPYTYSWGYIGYSGVNSLVYLNDVKKRSFLEIADYIEKEL